MKTLALALSILLHAALIGTALYMSSGSHVKVRLDVPVYNVDLVTLGQPAPAPKLPPAPAEQPKAPEAASAQPKAPEAKAAPEAVPVPPTPKPKPPEAKDISSKTTDKAPPKPKPKPKPKEPTADEILAEALKAAKADVSKKPKPSPQEMLQRELAELKKEVGGSPAPTGAGAEGVGASTGQMVYAQDVVARIKPNWRYPLAGTNQNLSAVVELKLTADGAVSSYRLVKSSGRPDFDASVLKAVDETKRLSPPPAGLRTIQITFNLQELMG